MKLTDVTLREGDQMPGRSYSAGEKVRAGKALDRLGVSYIQAGFPITGEKDIRAISQLSAEVDTAVVGLARARVDDVDAVIESGADVAEIFLSISDEHLDHVLGVSRETAFEWLHSAVSHAREYDLRVHLSLVDAFRADLDCTIKVFEEFPDVELITAADTVGARIPSEVREMVSALSSSINLDRFGVHFHDDLGVATANTLAAYEEGVGKADVSIASLGERAGNSSLEELLVASSTRHDQDFGLKVDELVPVCTEVIEALDESIQPRKAILGTEVTEHEAGIHTTAMLDRPSTFEPFDPSEFGGNRTLVFGEGTGKTGAKKLLTLAEVPATDYRITTYCNLLTQHGPVSKEEALELARSQFEA